jgi:hypothetical protein
MSNEVKKILAIDPGDVASGYVIMTNEKSQFKRMFEEPRDRYKIIEQGKICNLELRERIISGEFNNCFMAIEMVASYGMPVGASVFNTCVWIGRFMEAFKGAMIESTPGYKRIFRSEVKVHHCKKVSAKDANIVAALVDRFEDTSIYGRYGKGTKKNPGYFYGFAKDAWQAFALGVYIVETYRGVYKYRENQ